MRDAFSFKYEYEDEGTHTRFFEAEIVRPGKQEEYGGASV